jgi:hypothetical protein
MIARILIKILVCCYELSQLYANTYNSQIHSFALLIIGLTHSNLLVCQFWDYKRIKQVLKHPDYYSFCTARIRSAILVVPIQYR